MAVKEKSKPIKMRGEAKGIAPFAAFLLARPHHRLRVGRTDNFNYRLFTRTHISRSPSSRQSGCCAERREPVCVLQIFFNKNLEESRKYF